MPTAASQNLYTPVLASCGQAAGGMLETSREVLNLCLLQLGVAILGVRNAQPHDQRLLPVHGVGHMQGLRGRAAALRSQGIPACWIEPQLHKFWHGCLHGVKEGAVRCNRIYVYAD